MRYFLSKIGWRFPDGFGGWQWQFADGPEFMGAYVQDSSSEMRIAEAQGVVSSGIFVTDIKIQIEEADVIRRASDDLYLRVTGKPVKSPEPATSKLQRMNVEKTVKPK